MPSQQAPREDLTALRRRIVEMERLSGLPDGPARPRLSLGGPLDDALGGGLARDALHEAFPAEKGNAAAVLGFALALAAGTRKPVLWVRQDMSALEGGDLYGPGCAAFGLDQVTTTQVTGQDPIVASSLSTTTPPLSNVRIWDYNVVQPIY